MVKDIALLSYPNCPTETWWKLMEKYPLEAMESVLYPLLILEFPERWALIEQARAQIWINNYLNRLSDRQKQLWAADCAERVIPIYEQENPNNGAVRMAIEVRRRWAKNEISLDQWESARNMAWAAVSDSGAPAALAACWAAVHDDAWTVSLDAARATSYDRTGHPLNSNWETERVWQWRCLLVYLRIEES